MVHRCEDKVEIPTIEMYMNPLRTDVDGRVDLGIGAEHVGRLWEV